MAERFLSLIDSPGLGLVGLLLLWVLSLALLIELEHRQTGQPRRALWPVVTHALRDAVRSGVRGYFAPFRRAPWVAAWRAYRDPAGRWWSPLPAWVNAVAQIARGAAPLSPRPAGRDGPAA